MPKNWLLTRRCAIKLGLGMLTGIGTVAASKAVYLNKQIQKLDNPRRKFFVAGNRSLKERAAAKGLIYGAATHYSQLSSDTEFATNVKRECGMLVPEWELKWFVGDKPLRPGPNRFDFSRADWMANFAKANGLLLRGHTLVWHESLPPWFKETVNIQNAESILENHIRKVVDRYAGKIHSWDVVNEAITVEDGRYDDLRITPWLKLLGPNYIDLAFRLTAAVDPKTLLVYNEYGLDYDTPKADAKRNAVLKLLKRLRSKGTPIHALGIQAHLTAGEAKFSPEKFRQFLKDVASLGLKIMITEMDVTDQKLPVNINVRDRIIAGVYEDYLSVALEEPAVIAVLTWGLSDRYTWLSELKPRFDGAPVQPLPLDAELKRKFAWNAIARAFDNAPRR